MKYISNYKTTKIDDYIKDFLRNKHDSNQKIIEKISKKILCINKESQEMINLMNLIEGNNLELIEKDDSKVEFFLKETIDEAIKVCLDYVLSLVEEYSKLEDFT